MELKNTNKSSFADKPPLRFKDWEINLLIDYIVETHHAYSRKAIPEISDCFEKVVKESGKLHPELLSISKSFNEVATALMIHLEEEELFVFPFIKKYCSNKNFKQEINKEQLDKIHLITQKMENEHDMFGRKMDMIRIGSKNYNLPTDASENHSQLFNMLIEFENDFFIHLHLEAYILFPKISALYQ